MTTKPSSISKKRSARPPSIVTRILKSPLSSRLTPRPPASGPCCLSTKVAFSPPSLHIFIPETDPCGAELRHSKSKTASHQVSFGEVASLAGGSFISIHRHNRPQVCTVPQRCKTPQHPSSPQMAESLSPCVPELRSAQGHTVRPGSPVQLTGMEGLLSAPRDDSQLVFRIPLPD